MSENYEAENLRKLIPLVCSQIKTPFNHYCWVKGSSSDNSISIYGTGNLYRIWLERVPVDLTDDFEMCLDIDAIKSVFKDFKNITFRKKVITKGKNKGQFVGVNVESFTERGMVKTELRHSSIDLDLSRSFKPHNPQTMDRKDLDSIQILSRFIGGVYREVIYTDGLFLSLPDNSMGCIATIQSELTYSENFSIDLDTVKLLGSFSKVLDQSNLVFDIDERGRGVLAIGEYLWIEFNTQSEILPKFSGRSLETFLVSSNDKVILQTSSRKDMEYLTEQFGSLRRTERAKLRPVVVEIAPKGRVTLATIHDVGSEYSEINNMDTNIHLDEAYKMVIGDSFMLIAQGMAEYLKNNPNSFIELIARCDTPNGGEVRGLLGKSGDKKLTIVSGAVYAPEYIEYLKNPESTLKGFFEYRMG